MTVGAELHTKVVLQVLQADGFKDFEEGAGFTSEAFKKMKQVIDSVLQVRHICLFGQQTIRT